MSALALLILGFAVTSSRAEQQQNVHKWRSLSWRCVGESAAIECESGTTRVACLARASAFGLDVVAQWRASAGGCCVSRYQQACRLQSASADADQCETFVRNPLHWLIHSLSHKLVGVWVTSDTGGQFDNLVCSSSHATNNQMHSSNIAWSAEGATFNGVNSYMIVNDTEFMNFTGGSTLMARLKRTPANDPYVEAVDCSNHNQVPQYLWESASASQLAFAQRVDSPSNGKWSSQVGALPNDASRWIDVGGTVDNASGKCRLFVDGAFLPEASVTHASTTGFATTSRTCIIVGFSTAWGTFRLQATVSAVAVANASMTEEEIRGLFALLP